MYSLSFLIVELETARAALLDVLEVSNSRPKWAWHSAISGPAVRQKWINAQSGLPGTNRRAEAINDGFKQLGAYEKEIAY
jgi:hypothetical protein